MGEFEQTLQSIMANIKLPEHRKREIQREIESHLYEKMDDLIQSGYTSQEAIRLAIESLGDAETIGDEFNRVYREEFIMVAVIQNRIVIISSLFFGIFFSMFAMIFAIRDLSLIPKGSTTWHDYDGPAFGYLMSAIPMMVLFIGVIYKWIKQREKPSLLVMLVIIAYLIAILFNIGSTK
jgi:Arc/MetJ-type ribon-helix-helix transcriptional regulator